MDIYEKLISWLKTCPQIKGAVYVDCLPPVPGAVGLFPLGTEQLHVAEDVLGNRQIQLRTRLMLCTHEAVSKQVLATFMSAFCRWVQEQWAMGKTPTFGDLPKRERLYAEQEKKQKTGAGGINRYGVRLTLEYTKIYNLEGEEYGKD